MITRQQKLITAGVMFGLFLSAIEITSVGPAAPKIIHEMGGLNSYSWMFISYLLTSTLFMPLWGRASDYWGRKKLFLIAMTIFLLGCTLCGLSQNMTQLILARAFKGIGGGGLIPLAFTILADVFDLKSRTKVQGFLSATWGISSIIGPFIGGALADTLGWRWVFYICLFPGVIAIYLISKFFHEKHTKKHHFNLSIKSLINSFIFIITLIVGLERIKSADYILALPLCAAAFFVFIYFCYSEVKAKYPLIPPQLYQHKIFTMGCLTGFCCSGMIIGLASFSPLLFQAVMNYTATQSGLLLVPFSLAWVFGSIVSTRMMLTYNYKKLLFFGFSSTFVGFLFFMIQFYHLTTMFIIFCMILMGLGMAFNYPIVLISMQHDVPKNNVGFATSGLTWIRNLGSTIGTTVMGLILIVVFKNKLLMTITPAKSDTLLEALKQNPQLVFKPETYSQISQIPALHQSLNETMFWVMYVCLIQTLVALILSFFFPKKEIR